MKVNITQKGKELMMRCIDLEGDGSVLTLTGLTFGNGVHTDNVAESMQNPILKLDINDYERKGDTIELTSIFNNNSVVDRFEITEIGVLAKNPEEEDAPILFAYGCCTKKEAAVMPSVTDYIFETSFTVSVFIGSLDNIAIALEEKFTGVSKEDFAAHTKDDDNPHKVTAEQVGLGEVENKTLTDLTPVYSVAEDLQRLSPGEKVGILFGKIAKAVKELIAHISPDKTNPHGTTAKDVGAATESHDHSTNDMKSGILSVERGGTGVDTLSKLKALVGLQNIVVKTGTYIGSGKSGVANPNKLTFGGDMPLVVFVSGGTDSAQGYDCCTIVLGYGSTLERGGFTMSEGWNLRPSWGKDSVAWYSLGLDGTEEQRCMSQKSEAGRTYYYTAICLKKEKE